MNTQIRILISITFITSLTCSAFAQDEQNFEYTTPQSSGFSAVKLDSLSKFLTSAGSSSLILLVDGKIIFEWGKTDYKHTIHSIRKPLINALYGIYVEKGIIDTTATLQDLNIDDIIPSLSENEKSARIIDLLKSRSGVYHDAAANSSGMVSNRPERDEFIMYAGDTVPPVMMIPCHYFHDIFKGNLVNFQPFSLMFFLSDSPSSSMR